MELIKNHYAEGEKHRHAFTHHRSLQEHEVSRLRKLLPNVDRFGSDFDVHHHLNRPPSQQSSRPPSRASNASAVTERDEQPPSHLGTPNEARGTFAGLRNRLFGRRSSSPSAEADRLEAGQGPSNPNLLSPPSTRQNSGSPLELSRTQSVNRTIRFAEEARNDSDTAPAPMGANYGNSQPGFRRNPNLSMFRTSSVKEQDE